MILPLQRPLRTVIKSTAGLIILTILLGLSNCFLRPVSEKELIGTYQSVLPDGSHGRPDGTRVLPDGGTEILELKPDGTCEQNIALKDGRKFSATGTWQYERRYVTLKRIHISTDGDNINPDIGKIVVEANIFSVGRNFLGRIILGCTEVSYYEKK